MIVAFGCDHGGFSLKQAVIETIQQLGHEVMDFGIYQLESVDYPDYAEKAGRALQRKEAHLAVVLCGSGVGVCIAGNKMKGVYACLCHDTYSARQGVEHDNMNMLCLGARIIGDELAREIVKSFLGATFSTEERHRRRVGKRLRGWKSPSLTHPN